MRKGKEDAIREMHAEVGCVKVARRRRTVVHAWKSTQIAVDSRRPHTGWTSIRDPSCPSEMNNPNTYFGCVASRPYGMDCGAPRRTMCCSARARSSNCDDTRRYSNALFFPAINYTVLLISAWTQWWCRRLPLKLLSWWTAGASLWKKNTRARCIE